MDSQEEQVIRLLSDSTNRAVLEVLNDAAQDLSTTEIAERLVSRDDSVLRSIDYDDKLEKCIISLHHGHLPRLDEGGLIAYDPDENRVSYGDYTAANAEWREIEVIDELLSRFRTPNQSDESAIGVLDGRDEVYTYAREMTDKANEELFLIYTSEELLHEDCIPHAKNAIERDVAFYAGAKGRKTRRFFKQSLPEATIWEPQLDWMNDSSSYPTVSRLVFADREKVVVGLWDESSPDGRMNEIGMVGEGRTNPLVVLVRELLGPRLDHLDYQSETFLQNLPFET